MSRTYIPGTTTAVLSETSKMPHPSWGTRALRTCPYATFGVSEQGNQAVCGLSKQETSCYALGGRSSMTQVKRAYEARADFTLAALRSPQEGDHWVATLVEAIERAVPRSDPYFRWFDAGDFMSPTHVRLVSDVVAQTPWCRHWAPTRSWQAVIREWQEAGSPPVGSASWSVYGQEPASRWTRAFEALTAHSNIAVRPSALYVNESLDPAHERVLRALGFAGSAEVTTGDEFSCPASRQGGMCSAASVGGVDCRACWDDRDATQTYSGHGASFVTVEGLVNTRARRHS